MESVQAAQPTHYHKAHDAFLRLLGAALMALAGYAWLRLVGYFSDTQWRFDLMSTQWRVATLLTAVIGPVAALGLWLQASWGVALWLSIALFQIGIFGVLTDRFEARPSVVMMHIGCIAFYAALRIRIFFLEKPQAG